MDSKLGRLERTANYQNKTHACENEYFQKGQRIRKCLSYHKTNKRAQIYLFMSIYSGFATRNQQQYYDQVLYSIISTLLTRITKFYRNEDIDENSFRKIIRNQEKTLKKLEKRKYLEPKYSELLQYFQNGMADSMVELKKKEMNRTMSALDRQFHQLRDTNQRLLQMEKVESNSLNKIEQRLKKSKKKSKSKSNYLKSNIDSFDLRAQKRSIGLPSIQQLDSLFTKSKFNSKMNFQQANSRQQSDFEDDQNNQQSEKIIGLSKPPKFRAKMFFKQK